MRWIAASLLAVALTAGTAEAQDRAQTLADIRQELTVLFVELQRLKQELNTTGTVAGAGSGATLMDRVGAIESEVQRLTAKAEELEFRIDRVVTDGTNRIGDLEFRLCELEPDCDIAKLGETPSLGGVDVAANPVFQEAPSAGPVTEGPELAATERADFDRAQAMLEAGDFASAAQMFAEFNATYPAGPLSQAAEIGRGRALEGTGDLREAARAYLSAFSSDQLGPDAPEALVLLGAALGGLGQTQEACVTLGEVALRYPNAAEAQARAAAEMQALACG